jgi:hypothetical protein
MSPLPPFNPPHATNNPTNSNSTDATVPGVSGSFNTSDIFQQPQKSPNGAGGTGIGVYGAGTTGIQGFSDSGAGVFGQSAGFDAIVGESSSPVHAGVTGRNVNTNPQPGSVGIYGAGGQFAGKFDGDVLINGTSTVTGDHHCSGTMYVKVDVQLGGSDCAEDFEIASNAEIEPGTVMVLGNDGALRASQDPYDKKVAGVISGAGDYAPGLTLGKSQSLLRRMPLALVGKVYCKVDAGYAPVEVGDLLTSSPTQGHAMRADDPIKAFGAVIGKALRPLRSGQGLVPILVALQ